MSEAMPIHSTTAPESSIIGTAREWVQPTEPSVRITRCSNSKTVWSRIAASMAARTLRRSSGRMYFSIQCRLGSFVSAMNSRPVRWRITDQSALM